MTTEAGHAGGGGPRRAFNPRVVLLLAVLTALICGTVTLVDRLSPRDRGEPGRGLTGTQPGAAGAGNGKDVSTTPDKGVFP